MHLNDKRHHARAAIMFTDVAEEETRINGEGDELATLIARDLDVISRCRTRLGGLLLRDTGRGLLLCFESPDAALEGAVAAQRLLAAAPARTPLRHRIGVHLGEVYLTEHVAAGEAIDVAARVLGEAEPGGICFTEAVHEAVDANLIGAATSLGSREPVGTRGLVTVYQLSVAQGSNAPEIAPIPTGEVESPPAPETPSGPAEVTRAIAAPSLVPPAPSAPMPSVPPLAVPTPTEPPPAASRLIASGPVTPSAAAPPQITSPATVPSAAVLPIAPLTAASPPAAPVPAAPPPSLKSSVDAPVAGFAPGRRVPAIGVAAAACVMLAACVAVGALLAARGDRSTSAAPPTPRPSDGEPRIAVISMFSSGEGVWPDGRGMTVWTEFATPFERPPTVTLGRRAVVPAGVPVRVELKRDEVYPHRFRVDFICGSDQLPRAAAVAYIAVGDPEAR